MGRTCNCQRLGFSWDLNTKLSWGVSGDQERAAPHRLFQCRVQLLLMSLLFCAAHMHTLTGDGESVLHTKIRRQHHEALVITKWQLFTGNNFSDG